MGQYAKHLAFPFRIGTAGKPETVSSLEDHIRDELIQLVLTNLGERAFLPDFGGNVRRLVFEGASESSTAVAKATLTQAISRWLGHRINIVELTARFEESTIAVDLKYKIAGSEDTRVIRFEREGG